MLNGVASLEIKFEVDPVLQKREKKGEKG